MAAPTGKRLAGQSVDAHTERKMFTAGAAHRGMGRASGRWRLHQPGATDLAGI